jgi:hypothetical protein
MNAVTSVPCRKGPQPFNGDDSPPEAPRAQILSKNTLADTVGPAIDTYQTAFILQSPHLSDPAAVEIAMQ